MYTKSHCERPHPRWSRRTRPSANSPIQVDRVQECPACRRKHMLLIRQPHRLISF